ncbi:hypothetical protein CVG87_23880 [Pseudomonas sp. WCS365]|nr:hypothetical protein CVG87_23880 [Pseudomonas sp. WCS365]
MLTRFRRLASIAYRQFGDTLPGSCFYLRSAALVARELAPARVRSARRLLGPLQPSGSKLPRHRGTTFEVMTGRALSLIIKEALDWVSAHQAQLLEDWQRCYP